MLTETLPLSWEFFLIVRFFIMSNCAIVGINWGDEGKGRMVDLLTEDYDVVVRYQGGGNAGHTVVNEKGRFALHLLPSGIFREGVVNVLGNGVALDCESLWTEMEDVTSQGVDITPENLKISDRAIVVSTTDASALRDAQRTVTELMTQVGTIHLVVNRVQPKLLKKLHTTIDDAMDTSEMMNQMVQMQMISAITNLTETNVMTYASSLVGKVVTIGIPQENGLEEREVLVTGTGVMNGQQVIFGKDSSGNVETYGLNQIMAVGKLPAKKPEEGDETEKPGEDGSVDKPEGPGEGESVEKPGEGEATPPETGEGGAGEETLEKALG